MSSDKRKAQWKLNSANNRVKKKDLGEIKYQRYVKPEYIAEMDKKLKELTLSQDIVK